MSSLKKSIARHDALTEKNLKVFHSRKDIGRKKRNKAFINSQYHHMCSYLMKKNKTKLTKNQKKAVYQKAVSDFYEWT